jgi:hypothetical protein
MEQRSTSASPTTAGTVDNVLSLATQAGLSGWASVDGTSDEHLEARLLGILGRLRNRAFHSLSALNAAIRDSMVDLNAHVMRDWLVR